MEEKEIISTLKEKLKDFNKFARSLPENYQLIITQVENTNAITIEVSKKINVPYIFSPVEQMICKDRY